MISPLDELPLLIIEEFQGADEGGKDAAAVDVPDEQHRGSGHAGHPHVDDLGFLKVYLRRTACPFDDHDIVLRA